MNKFFEKVGQKGKLNMKNTGEVVIKPV